MNTSLKEWFGFPRNIRYEGNGCPEFPKERAKPNTKPANTPGRERGNVIVKKTRQGEAPSVCAACSNLKSMLSKERRIARTTNGNATTAEANTAPSN